MTRRWSNAFWDFAAWLFIFAMLLLWPFAALSDWRREARERRTRRRWARDERRSR